jgi:hypothetical protein
MVDLIQDRKTSEKQEQRYDLFSGFLDANDDEDLNEAKLSMKELFGALFHIC